MSGGLQPPPGPLDPPVDSDANANVAAFDCGGLRDETFCTPPPGFNLVLVGLQSHSLHSPCNSPADASEPMQVRALDQPTELCSALRTVILPSSCKIHCPAKKEAKDFEQLLVKNTRGDLSCWMGKGV